MKKNNRYCRGCIYHGKVSGDTCCDYILVTQRRRPCKAGKDCTVRRTKGEKPRVGLVEATT